jgi:hypothetical protein
LPPEARPQPRLGTEPACWSWRITDEARELVRLATLTPHHVVQARLWGLALQGFTQGRCGLCGHVPLHMVLDHDHRTGLVRGGLCRGCNTSEGMNRDPSSVFAKYRTRYPYLILGIEEPYDGYGWEMGEPVGGWEALGLSVPSGMVSG